jgi:hypothetical protein
MNLPRPPRLVLDHHAGLEVDHAPATLVNVSPNGAQVLSGAVLRPEQRVRLVLLSPAAPPLRMTATVRWSVLEIPNRRPHYRAGVEFLNADAALLASFTAAHRSSRPPETPA